MVKYRKFSVTVIVAWLVALVLLAVSAGLNIYTRIIQPSQLSGGSSVAAAAWYTRDGYVCLSRADLEFYKCTSDGKGHTVLKGKAKSPNGDALFTQAGMKTPWLIVSDLYGDYNYLSAAKEPPNFKVLRCANRESDHVCIWDGSKFHIVKNRAADQAVVKH